MMDLPIMSAFPSLVIPREPYVIKGHEKPADLPSLKSSASRMEAMVLAYFAREPYGTPSECAEALGVDVTSVRPRISQLSREYPPGPLQRMKWMPRKPTKAGGSEGLYRMRRSL